VSSTEYGGRGAGRGNSAVVTGRMRSAFTGRPRYTQASRMASVKACHVTSPALAK
jgi:hypothetical protein